MDRAHLDNYSLEELKREAHRYRLPIVNDRAALIDSIMNHFELNSPADDAQLGARTREQARPRKAQSDHAVQEAVEFSSVGETAATSSALETIVKSLQLCIEQQKDMMLGIRALTERQTTAAEPANGGDALTRSNSGPLPSVSSDSPAQASYTAHVASSRIRGDRRGERPAMGEKG